MIVTQGGAARGYAVYLTAGKLAFAVRENGELTEIVAKDPLGNSRFLVQATLRQDGDLALLVDGKKVAEGKAAGLIRQQPKAGYRSAVPPMQRSGNTSLPTLSRER